jgi:phosphate transport system substrate-binding protein
MPRACSLCCLPIVAVLISLGCSSQSAGRSEREARLTVTGSSTIAPLMNEIGKRFETLHPGVRVDIQTGGSARGVADVRRGLADIGLVSRTLRESEADLQGFTIAHDGICLILHADNPIESLTEQQVVDVYTGRITRWSELGGLARPITVVNKAEGRSTLDLFAAHFGISNRDIQASVVIGDNQQGVKVVAGNPDAIGYVSIGTAETSRLAGAPLKLLSMSGVEATAANVAEGAFPLSRPLNLVTSRSPTGQAEELIEFARSSAVHDLIREASFVPAQ